MKRNIKQTLALAALALVALLPTGCSNDDDFGNLPAGSIPLELGDVTVAGMTTTTRAAITEDGRGFTGIRKSRFVEGDELDLTLSNDGGTTGTNLTATLTGGLWVLSQDKVFVIPGTTTIKATYTPSTIPADAKADALAADSYTLVGQKLTLDLKHINALVDITCPAGITPTDITLTANDGSGDQPLTTAPEEESDGTMHYRSILAPGMLKSITATINGMNYTATLDTDPIVPGAQPLTVAANKRYPISLTFKANQLSATVGSGELNWGDGGTTGMDNFPPGYDLYISTPEDLAQFAKDVNDAGATMMAKALQTADIDLSKLMTAAAATAANPGKTYTYTATADNWVPINNFMGTYNGNGNSISNLKINAQPSDMSSGLFSNLYGNLTGIHLRDVDIKGMRNVGSLTSSSMGSTITLCSATGSISSADPSELDNMGGLIGGVYGGIHITRCSANVTINSTSTSEYSSLGGLIGYENSSDGSGSSIIGCMATGNVTGVKGCCAGLIGKVNNSTIMGCVATGEVASSAGTDYALIGPATGGGVVPVVSCYAKGKDGMEFGPDTDVNYFWCAYTGSLSTAPLGVTGNIADASLYTTIASTGQSVSDVKTLHWSRADGYTTNVLTTTWNSKNLWKNNPGTAPTIDMTYEGE